MRLRFRNEAQAKHGFAILMGDKDCEGIIPQSGLMLKAQLCASELHLGSGIEKCVCLARKMKVEIDGMCLLPACVLGEIVGLTAR